MKVMRAVCAALMPVWHDGVWHVTSRWRIPAALVTVGSAKRRHRDRSSTERTGAREPKNAYLVADLIQKDDTAAIFAAQQVDLAQALAHEPCLCAHLHSPTPQSDLSGSQQSAE